MRSFRDRFFSAAHLLLIVLVLMGYGLTQGAPTVEDARTAIAEAPEDSRAWVSLGHAWLAEADPELALEAFERALSFDPNLCDAHDGVGLSTYRLGESRTALAAFSEVVRLCPSRFDGHFNQAVAFARLGQPEEAIEAFARSLDEAAPEATNGERARAWQGVASQASLLERYDEAAVAYRAARRLAPREKRLLLLEAEAWMLAGQPGEALAELAAFEARAGDHEASLLLAQLHRALQDDNQARLILEAALRNPPQVDPALHAALAWQLAGVAQALGDVDGVRRALEAVLTVTPSDSAALMRLGSLELEQGNLLAARNALTRARDLAPLQPEVRIALAWVYRGEGNDHAALEESRAALEILESEMARPEQDEGDAREADRDARTRALALATQSAYRLADHAEVERLALEWLELDAASHDAWTWLGLQAYQQERFEEAITAFESALRHAPQARAVRSNLASALLAAERYGEAEDAYRALVEAFPQDGSFPYYYGWALLGEERSGEAREAWVSACNLGYRKACEDLAETF